MSGGNIHTAGPSATDSPLSRSSSPVSDVDSVTSSSLPTGSRLGSLASAQLSSFNLSSLGLAQQVATSSSTSSSHLTGFNAISTVLNNPNKKQHPIDPRSSRFTSLPTHKDAEIQRVSKDSVQGYIDNVSKEWARYVRNRDLGSKGKAKMQNAVTATDDNPIAQAAAQTLAQGKGKGKLPPLSAVPQIFFDEEFNLGNPYTFDIVTEKYGAVGVPDITDESTSPTHHLDKLSHYSDLVEQHLLHEISTRSSSFFSALGALQDLSQSSASCLSLIRSLRSDLVSIDESQVTTGLQIVRKQDHRWAVLRDMQAVQTIQQWSDDRRMAELMIGQGEYEEALLVIERLKSQAAPSRVQDEEDEDSPHSLDLSQIPAIQALLPDLDDLQSNISQALENELSSLLGSELESRHQSNTTTWSLANRVTPLLHGLLRTHSLERTLTTTYRPIVLASVRSALRHSLPQDDTQLAALFDLLDDDLAATGKGESRSGEAGVTAAKRLRELDVKEFREGVLVKSCDGLEAVIESIAQQSRHILAALDDVARSQDNQQEDPSTTSDEYLMPSSISYSLPQSLTSQLHSAIEVAHILLARLISLRASSHVDLALEHFLSIFNPLMAFAERTERISLARNQSTEATGSVGVRRLIPLRSTLLNQSKEWLRQFHRTRLEKAARFVEEETWSQVDVKDKDIEVVKKLVDCAMADPAEWRMGQNDAISTEGTKDDESASTQPTLPVASSEDVKSESSTPPRSYYVVPATVQTVHLTQSYLITLVNFSSSQISASTEVMSRLVEFLKQFNSRTCQVVLGAGAMRSAGLKNITAKHLALASQSLSLFIHLIPYLRECVRRHLPDERQSVMLIEFDKLKRDYQEHQNEIHSKLVAIMGDRLSVHCRGLAGADWNAPLAPDTAPSTSKSITDLVKETMTLQKVLTRYLATSTVDLVLNQVLDSIVKRVGIEFAKVEVSAEGGDACRLRMEKDVEYLDTKLGSLKSSNEGIVWDTEALKAVVASKTPPSTAAAAAAAAAPRESTDIQPSPRQSEDHQAPSTPQMSSSATMAAPGTPPTGPPAYKSRMFPFGRRGTASQQQSSSPAGSPSSTPVLGQGQSSSSYFSSYIARRPQSPHQGTPTRGGAAGAAARMVPVDAQDGGADDDSRGASIELVSAAPSAPVQEAEKALDEKQLAVVEAPIEKGTDADADADATITPHADTTNAQEDTVKEAAPLNAAAEIEDSSSRPSSFSGPPAAAAVPALPEESGPVNEAEAQSSSPRPSSPSLDQASTSTDTASASASTDSSTDTPSSAPATATATPTRPARMTLQQRLAEAARKRSQAQAQAQAQGKMSLSVDDDHQQQQQPASPPPPPTPEKDSQSMSRSSSRSLQPPEVAEAPGVAEAEPKPSTTEGSVSHASPPHEEEPSDTTAAAAAEASTDSSVPPAVPSHDDDHQQMLRQMATQGQAQEEQQSQKQEQAEKQEQNTKDTAAATAPAATPPVAASATASGPSAVEDDEHDSKEEEVKVADISEEPMATATAAPQDQSKDNGNEGDAADAGADDGEDGDDDDNEDARSTANDSSTTTPTTPTAATATAGANGSSNGTGSGGGGGGGGGGKKKKNNKKKKGKKK